MNIFAYNGKQISTVVDVQCGNCCRRAAYNGKQISTVVDDAAFVALQQVEAYNGKQISTVVDDEQLPPISSVLAAYNGKQISTVVDNVYAQEEAIEPIMANKFLLL